MSKARKDNLIALSKTISDYRSGEIEPHTPETIDAWLGQFPADIQELLLAALTTVLERTYITRDTFKDFLRGLASNKKLTTGSEPSDYWKRANILDIQRGGTSQKEILTMFGEVLQETHGVDLKDTRSDDGDCVYIDDCVGTGIRVLGDICTWLESETPKQINLHVVAPILYLGSWWIDDKIKESAKRHGKTITINKWRIHEMENRKGYRDNSDVLWPSQISNDEATQEYVGYLRGLGHPPQLRQPGQVGAAGIFEDDAQKVLVEQAMLDRGCQIRQKCTNLPDVARPLGFHNLKSLGFGSMFVTYRNCPNNCPLALWVQQDGYPELFPRKTNTQSAYKVNLGGKRINDQ